MMINQRILPKTFEMAQCRDFNQPPLWNRQYDGGHLSRHPRFAF